MVLDLASVGGTILGTARGRTEADVMVSTLKKMGVNMLFVVGGDGSLLAAAEKSPPINDLILNPSSECASSSFHECCHHRSCR